MDDRATRLRRQRPPLLNPRGVQLSQRISGGWCPRAWPSRARREGEDDLGFCARKRRRAGIVPTLDSTTDEIVQPRLVLLVVAVVVAVLDVVGTRPAAIVVELCFTCSFSLVVVTVDV